MAIVKIISEEGVLQEKEVRDELLDKYLDDLPKLPCVCENPPDSLQIEVCQHWCIEVDSTNISVCG
jgi:hypothetical protein